MPEPRILTLADPINKPNKFHIDNSKRRRYQVESSHLYGLKDSNNKSDNNWDNLLMAYSNSLSRKCLPLSIRQHLRPRKASLLVAIGLLASQPITPLMADDSIHYEWSCLPGADGKGWNCRETPRSGRDYRRPQRSTTQQTLAQTPATLSSQRNLDWVEKELLTPEQQAEQKAGCCGAYVEPERDYTDAELKPEDASLRASADKSEIIEDSTAVLEGDVRLTQGYRQLTAEKASLDQSANIATLEGNIALREPGVLITGSEAQMNMTSGHAVIQDAQYVLHKPGVRGGASSIEHFNDNTLVLDDGSFTNCAPDSNVWELRGSEIKLDPTTQQGYGKHVRLNIKGVPVFYTPYMQFPIGSQRLSGFLFPSIGTSDGGGADITIPYYFNLAPNYDLTLAARTISDRGEALELETRHLSEDFKTTISGAYLADDAGGDDADDQDMIDDGLITEAEAMPYKGEDRWLLNIDQNGGLAQRWSTRIDVTKASDEDYFRDIDTKSLSVNSRTHLKRMGQASYRSDNWLYQIKAEEYQTIVRNRDEPYKQLPRINIDGNYRFGDWVAELNNEYTSFDHSEDFTRTGANIITGDRARLDYSLSWDKEWLWGFFKPSAAVKSLHYQLDDKNLHASADDAPSVTVPQATVDAGLFFEREGNGYSQTFEPRLFYFYSEDESHEDFFDLTADNRDIDFDTSESTFAYNQLFRDTRFSGGDRIDDANQLSVGLTSRFIGEKSGIEWLRLSLGQIFYFDDRRVGLNDYYSDDEIDTLEASVDGWESDLHSADMSTRLAARNNLNKAQRLLRDDSEWAAQISGQLGQNLRYGLDVLWDEDDGTVSRGSSYLRYFDEQQRIINIGYRYIRKAGIVDSNDADQDGITNEIIDRDIEQGDISLIWPIAGNWSVVARHNQDFTNSRELETFAGLEYNSCCYRVRLLARRWLDNSLINTIDDTLLEHDNGIFLEFELKGLGSIGRKIDGILDDGVINYRQRENNL